VQQDSGFVPGRDLDLGAEFIHGDVNPIVELCEAHGWRRRHIFTWSHGDGGPADGPAPDGGVGYYFLARERRLLRYDSDDADMRVCNEALWALETCERQAAERDRRSLRQYLEDSGVPERMLGLACAGYGNTAGGTADSVPVTRAMRFERAWHGDGSELDPDFRLEPSFGVLVAHLAQGLRVETGCPVQSVECAAGGAAPPPAATAAQQYPVAVTTRDGRRLRARRAIVTVPLSVLRDGDIRFEPPLAPSKVEAAKSMSFANGVKIVLKLSRPAWPANCHGVVCADSLIPEMWMNSSVGVGGVIDGSVCKYGASSSGGGESASSTCGPEDEVKSLSSSSGRSGGGFNSADRGEPESCCESVTVGAAPPLPPAALHSGATSRSTPDSASFDEGAEDALDADADADADAADEPPYDETDADDESACCDFFEAGAPSVACAEPVEKPAAPAPTVFLVTGFIMGERANALLKDNSQALVIARMLSQLDAMFGLDASGALISGFVHNWGQEEFIRGAYSTPTVREHSDASRRLAEPHEGLVFFAGEATAGAVEGTERSQPQNAAHFAPPIVLHGAMNTGSRAACEVARSLGLPVTCCVDAATHRHFTPTYLNAGSTHGYESFSGKTKQRKQLDDFVGPPRPGGRQVACSVVRSSALSRAVAEKSAQL